ncbi:MAG: sensor histidine kinase [Alphaproteobacteria bacterium]|nr:sensor histidine kinase [Alphaproteobacteria bacterium]
MLVAASAVRAPSSAAGGAPGWRVKAHWAALAIVGVIALVGGFWAAGEMARARAVAVLQRDAAASAALHAAVLRSELEKQRSTPFVLAADPDVAAALRSHDPAQARALSRKLEALSRGTRAAAIYVMDSEGTTLAASNWREPLSFVGQNYSFRPYFTKALRVGSAEYFALGTVSRRPGLFLARRVRGPHGVLGVVAVKVEMDALEAEWRASDAIVLVASRGGVVLITNHPEWRFRTFRPMPAAVRARIERTKQFGGAPLAPLPLSPLGVDGLVSEIPLADAGPPSFVQVSTGVGEPGWRLYLLKPANEAIRGAVRSAQLITLLLTALVFAGLAALLRRQEREALMAAQREAARAELEARVAERTRQLRETNERLLVEMEERRRAESLQQEMHDELIQASKLAVLGQIAAGVAHEINQPVAAIRAYADNAAAFLERADPQPAQKNLGVIAVLTERIGAITEELRAFSRKTTRDVRAVELEEALAGALVLVGPRLHQQRVDVVRRGASDIFVRAERVRLEQVFVNLLQNAVEAVEGRPDPRVRVTVEATSSDVTVAISDNGAGLQGEAASGLFKPFTTTKKNGLGLGLVISRDIVTEFGGELQSGEGPDGGAEFVVTLRRCA